MNKYLLTHTYIYHHHIVVLPCSLEIFKATSFFDTELMYIGFS